MATGENLKLGLPDQLKPLPTDVDIVNQFIDLGVKDYFQVPCSVTNTVSDLLRIKSRKGEIRLTNITNEPLLVGIALGVWLGSGNIPLIHAQNSGFPDMIGHIVSVAKTYGLPLSILETFRGSSLNDDSEPHQASGAITEIITKLTVGENHVFGDISGKNILENIKKSINDARNGNVSVALLPPEAFTKIHKLSPLPTSADIFSQDAEDEELERKDANLLQIEKVKGRLSNPLRPFTKRLSREEALMEIEALHPNALIIESNGYTARAGQTVAKRKGHFHNAGGMGMGAAMGYGAAWSNPDLEVVVVDGDQNAQMGIAIFNELESTFLSLVPNLYLYMLDNRSGASVGTPESVPLMRIFDTFYRKIPTISDGHLPFKHDRVKARGAYFDQEEAMALAKQIGPLPIIAQEARRFAEEQSARNRTAKLSRNRS